MDCTAAATITVLRMIDAPGALAISDGSQTAIDAVRLLATGDAALAIDGSHGLYPEELGRAVRALGANARVSSDVDEILGAVRHGSPAVVSGNGALLEAGSGYARDGDVYIPHSIAVTSEGGDARSWLVSNPGHDTPDLLSEQLVRAFLTDADSTHRRSVNGSATYPALLVSRPDTVPAAVSL